MFGSAPAAATRRRGVFRRAHTHRLCPCRGRARRQAAMRRPSAAARRRPSAEIWVGPRDLPRRRRPARAAFAPRGRTEPVPPPALTPRRRISLRLTRRGRSFSARRTRGPRSAVVHADGTRSGKRRARLSRPHDGWIEPSRPLFRVGRVLQEPCRSRWAPPGRSRLNGDRRVSPCRRHHP